jgi:hypothetical protein
MSITPIRQRSFGKKLMIVIIIVLVAGLTFDVDLFYF